jgi:predicted Zn-dependent protease
MKKVVFSIVLILFTFQSCKKQPITGRRQFNLLPESQMQTMALQSYNQFLTQNKPLANNSANVQMVQRIGNRIANAATEYLKARGFADRIANYKWEFNVVDSKEVNAWCMPGGKVVVYTGILPVTQNEDALAVVMGHEIAHAIAQHGNERMSQGLLAQLGGVALSVALANKPQETQNIFNQAYGAGASLGVILPFSRKHESEADEMGIIFSAKAGYNPQEAVAFWQRMSKLNNGQKPPELLSTHPSDETRIKKLKEIMPKAMILYNNNKQ